MSQENVKIVESMYAAFASGDVPAVLGAMDPQIVWNEAENFPYADGNPYVGPDAIVEGVFMRLGSEWEYWNLAIEDLLDAGDTVVALGRYQAKNKADRSRDQRPVRPLLGHSRRQGRDLPAIRRHRSGSESRGQSVAIPDRLEHTQRPRRLLHVGANELRTLCVRAHRGRTTHRRDRGLLDVAGWQWALVAESRDFQQASSFRLHSSRLGPRRRCRRLGGQRPLPKRTPRLLSAPVDTLSAVEIEVETPVRSRSGDHLRVPRIRYQTGSRHAGRGGGGVLRVPGGGRSHRTDSRVPVGARIGRRRAHRRCSGGRRRLFPPRLHRG